MQHLHRLPALRQAAQRFRRHIAGIARAVLQAGAKDRQQIRGGVHEQGAHRHFAQPRIRRPRRYLRELRHRQRLQPTQGNDHALAQHVIVVLGDRPQQRGTRRRLPALPEGQRRHTPHAVLRILQAGQQRREIAPFHPSQRLQGQPSLDQIGRPCRLPERRRVEY